MDINIPFRGPLFIVGNGRSGTKLIRSLLNNHSYISLPDIESQFIPDFVNKWPTQEQNNFQTYFSYLKKTPFFYRMGKKKEFIKDDLLGYKKKGSPAEFIEFVLKYSSIKFNDFKNFEYIWGDKTPLYIRNIDLLKRLYSQAKFIHIIRDPRDVALSYKKTWGKSLYGAAEKWREIMANNEEKRYQEKDWFIEINYEKLINSPDQVLINVCDFLQLPYEKSMNNLKSPVETFGEANQKVIKKDNTKKYRRNLSSNQVKKIESIVKPYLIKQGYELEHEGVAYQPLKKTQKKIYRTTDYIMFLLHHLLREDGIKGVAINIKSQARQYLMG